MEGGSPRGYGLARWETVKQRSSSAGSKMKAIAFGTALVGALTASSEAQTSAGRARSRANPSPNWTVQSREVDPMTDKPVLTLWNRRATPVSTILYGSRPPVAFVRCRDGKLEMYFMIYGAVHG